MTYYYWIWRDWAEVSTGMHEKLEVSRQGELTYNWGEVSTIQTVTKTSRLAGAGRAGAGPGARARQEHAQRRVGRLDQIRQSQRRAGRQARAAQAQGQGHGQEHAQRRPCRRTGRAIRHATVRRPVPGPLARRPAARVWKENVRCQGQARDQQAGRCRGYRGWS